MIIRTTAVRQIVVFSALAAMLAGCAGAPLGPTVQASPGRGKSMENFTTDQAGCKTFATSQIQGSVSASNTRAVLTSLNSNDDNAVATAAAGSANDQVLIQQQYDAAYGQCMVSKGEVVPGFGPAVAVATAAPMAPPDPLIRSAQSELIRLGYLKGGADGYSGPKTRGAISSFEQANGLPVDGSATPRLLGRLQSTPTNAAAATASAPSNWVAPTSSASVTPAAAAAPATPSGWVTPTKN